MLTEPNILVFHPKDAEAYAQVIRNAQFSSVRTASTYEEAERHLPQTDIILGWKFPTTLLNQPIASSVRWYQSTGAGVDDILTDKTVPSHILLTRIVDQFGSAIAEYVFTFLLSIVKDVARMRRAQFEQHWDPFISGSLAGKTIGIAGLGSIGAEIVRKARAFDMKVLGLSARGRNAALVDEHFFPEAWKAFVTKLDYLVLTLPLTEGTRHVVNREVLLAMKPDACLINVGRGSLVVEKELLKVMKSGHLKAAILDVFEKEPLQKNHPFYLMPNVYITPHLSGPSTIDGVTKFFIENLKKYIQGESLQGVVERNRGY